MDASKKSEKRNFSFAMSWCSNIVPIHWLTISSARSKTSSKGRLLFFPIWRIMHSTISESLFGSGSNSVLASDLFQRCGKLVTTVSEICQFTHMILRKSKYRSKTQTFVQNPQPQLVHHQQQVLVIILWPYLLEVPGDHLICIASFSCQEVIVIILV